MITKSKNIQCVKEDIITNIRNILVDLDGKFYWSDYDEGCSPVIQEDPFDENNTYTLDSVEVNGVWASNCSENAFFQWDSVSIEILEVIYDGMTNYIEE